MEPISDIRYWYHTAARIPATVTRSPASPNKFSFTWLRFFHGGCLIPLRDLPYTETGFARYRNGVCPIRKRGPGTAFEALGEILLALKMDPGCTINGGPAPPFTEEWLRRDGCITPVSARLELPLLEFR